MAENLDNKDLEYMTDKQSEYSEDIDVIFNENDDEDTQIVEPSIKEEFQGLAEDSFVDNDFSDMDLDFVDSIQENSEDEKIIEIADTVNSQSEKEHTDTFSSEDIFANFESITSFIENANAHSSFDKNTSDKTETEVSEDKSSESLYETAIESIEEEPSPMENVSENNISLSENTDEVSFDGDKSVTNATNETQIDLSDSYKPISLEEEEKVVSISNEEEINSGMLNSETPSDEAAPVEITSDEDTKASQPEMVADDEILELSDSYNEVSPVDEIKPVDSISDEEIIELSDAYDELLQEETHHIESISVQDTSSLSETEEEKTPEPETVQESSENDSVPEIIPDNQTEPDLDVPEEKSSDEPEAVHDAEIDDEDAIIIKKDAPIENIEIIVPEQEESPETENYDSQAEETKPNEIEVISPAVPEKSAPSTEEENLPELKEKNTESAKDETEILDTYSSDFVIIEEDEEKQDIISLNADDNKSLIGSGSDDKSKAINEEPEQVSIENAENFTLSNEPELVISENGSEEEITETAPQKSPDEEYIDENVFAVCSIDDNRGFYFARNEQTYALFGYLHDEIILLKDFQELIDKHMGIRLEERKFYSESYLVKVNSYKFLVEVDETSMKIVMEL